MKALLISLALLCALISPAQADSPALKIYQKGDWKSLTKAYEGQPVAVHFWGVTCAPCAREMPQWGRFIEKNKNDKIVFIQVDDVPADSAAKMLSNAKLNLASSYTLGSPFDDALRYEIDPKWRGETPMTLLIDKNGKVIKKVGSIDFEKLKQWYLSASSINKK